MHNVWNRNVITPEARRVAEVRYKFAKKCRRNVQKGKPVPKLHRSKTNGDQEILQKCKVFCELGRGSYGRVLKVLYEGKVACLKRAHADSCKASFETEVQFLRRLDGKGGAPRVHAVADDFSAFVMDCFHGDCLADLVDRHPYKEPLPYLWIYFEITKAMRQIHDAGFVHLDYKSDNVIVNCVRSGESVVHLIDFGMACEIGEVTYLVGEYNSAAHYAPELYRDDVAVTPMLDVYALGLCLYDTMVGLVDDKHIPEWPGYDSFMGFVETMMDYDKDQRPDMKTVEMALRVQIHDFLQAKGHIKHSSRPKASFV